MTTTTSQRQARSRRWLGAGVLVWVGLAATLGSQGCAGNRRAAGDAKTDSRPAAGDPKTACEDCVRTVVFSADPDPSITNPCVEMFPTDLRKVSRVTEDDNGKEKANVICFLNHTGCAIMVEFKNGNKGVLEEDKFTLAAGTHKKPKLVTKKILSSAEGRKYEFSWTPLSPPDPNLACKTCPGTLAGPSIIIHPQSPP